MGGAHMHQHPLACTCSSLRDQIYQIPANIYKNPGQSAKIHCSHSIESYDHILWYKQSKNNQMQLLGHMYGNSGLPETGLNVKIDGSAKKDQNSTLSIEGLSLSSSAVYFCALRLRHCC
uniref:Ig-like domain-containing protein n=1 Tax=Stegastes partitus TaxID=144197 RepID=A0A3B4ZPN1_9TELE